MIFNEIRHWSRSRDRWRNQPEFGQIKFRLLQDLTAQLFNQLATIRLSNPWNEIFMEHQAMTHVRSKSGTTSIACSLIFKYTLSTSCPKIISWRCTLKLEGSRTFGVPLNFELQKHVEGILKTSWPCLKFKADTSACSTHVVRYLGTQFCLSSLWIDPDEQPASQISYPMYIFRCALFFSLVDSCAPYWLMASSAYMRATYHLSSTYFHR